MLRAKGNEEFIKWWQYWMSTLAQNRIKHPTSGKKPRRECKTHCGYELLGTWTPRNSVNCMASFEASVIRNAGRNGGDR